MASAVLPSRNEPHYMRKFTSSNNNPFTVSHSQFNTRFNPNPNPSPNFNPTRHLVHNVSAHELFSTRVSTPVAPVGKTNWKSSNAVVDGDRCNDSFRREFVTYNLGAYSKIELKSLKKRLINDLERVRGVIKRIEGQDFARNVVVEPLNQPALPPKVGKSKKRALGLGLATGKDSKRGRVVVEGDKDKFVASIMRKCKQILMKLMKHKHGWVFNTPVDVKGLKLYDYYDIIKKPMDLGTVKLRLERKEYGTIRDFAADVRLTFNNAMTYNPKGQDVHHMAEMLLGDFEEMFKPVNKKYDAAEHPKVGTVKQRILSQAARITPPNVLPVVKEPDPVRSHSTLLNQHQFQAHKLIPPPVFVTPAVKSPPRPVITPRSGKLPKPKAKDPNKREMTFEEKSKLGEDLQILPIEKMEQVVLIVKRRNPNLAQEDDEIELDFEALDSETLWELDRFLTYHKKAVSQMKRQGVTEDVAAKELNKLPEKAPTPEHVMHKNKKGGEVWEEDVDIGDEMPVVNFPPVQIEKDAPCASSGSSSSSSSSSGSDSSSSDSGSSSGSDSDEDSVQSPFVEAKQVPTT